MTRIKRRDDQPIERARLEDEWLEADGFGGFASGTVGTLRTRRYHALLLAATRGPAARIVLVNGVEAWLETDGVHYPLSMQCYAPDIIYPDIVPALLGFDTAPWPTWCFYIDEHTQLTVEIFVAKATSETVLRWALQTHAGRLADVQPSATQSGIAQGDAQRAAATPGMTPQPDRRRPARYMLKVRPLLSGRDYHALHHENAALNFAADVSNEPGETRVRWQTYGDVPAIHAAANGSYTHAPDWYRNFCYVRERERGLDFTEDLATPGFFTFDLAQRDAVMILNAGARDCKPLAPDFIPLASRAIALTDTERERRASFGTRLQRSTDAYVIARENGRTIVAGFPWFTDWGRDTFIAMGGLLLGTGRFDQAESILLGWAGSLSEGMLPNRFPDNTQTPEYNSVDASLWFAIAVHDYLATGHASAATRERLQQTVDAILDGYTRGTRFGIAGDADGLLRAGVPGVQLTWMDAKAGDWVVTPRIGKPVEVQALWINALRIAAVWNPSRQDAALRATQSFHARFVDPASGALFDNVDVDHVAGAVDRSIRPNQIFAVGGLPFALLEGAAARAVVDQVEQHLLTPMGLRTLAPADPAYRGRYAGGVLERDGAYHQGTVWPWLLDPFVDAWLRVRDAREPALTEARTRFLAPLQAHLDHAGLDHVSEVADGDPPHTPGGTPFQAWSLAALLRIATRLGAG